MATPPVPPPASRCSDCGTLLVIDVAPGTRCLDCGDKSRGCQKALGWCNAHRQSIVECRGSRTTAAAEQEKEANRG